MLRVILLLADVLENLISNCLEIYKLDPAHFLSTLGFSVTSMVEEN